MVWGGSAAGQESGDDAELDPVVIVHGAWGGIHHWRPVADSIEAKTSRRVVRAELTGLGTRRHLLSRDIRLDTHVEDVVQRIEVEDLRNVCLIAHSYGGAVATGVIDRIGDRIDRVLFLDALVPNHGETAIDLRPGLKDKFFKQATEGGEGWYLPVAWQNDHLDTPHPLATLTQPIRLTNGGRQNARGTFWLFTDGADVDQDERLAAMQRAVGEKMTVAAFDWDHNPHRSSPGELVDAIVDWLATTDRRDP